MEIVWFGQRGSAWTGEALFQVLVNGQQRFAVPPNFHTHTHLPDRARGPRRSRQTMCREAGQGDNSTALKQLALGQKSRMFWSLSRASSPQISGCRLLDPGTTLQRKGLPNHSFPHPSPLNLPPPPGTQFPLNPQGGLEPLIYKEIKRSQVPIFPLGWRDGCVATNAGCFSRGPKFCSQNPRWVAPHSL